MPHTPGPWTVEEEHHGVLNVCSTDHGTFCRPARINGDAADDVYGEIIRANANLIAAAPDLLAACKLLLADWEMVSPKEPVPEEINVDSHWATLREAIAKAEGKS